MREGVLRLGFLFLMVILSGVLGNELGTDPIAWLISSLLIALGIRAIV